jgi:hypothetical protein
MPIIIMPTTTSFYLVDRGLRHRLPGFSSLDRPVVLTQGLRRFRCHWSHCGSCSTGPDSRGAGLFNGTETLVTQLVCERSRMYEDRT